MFDKITVNDLTIEPLTLRQVIVDELTSKNFQKDSLVNPVIEAIQLFLEQAGGLNRISKKFDIYVYPPYDELYPIGYIDNPDGQENDIEEYVFSKESFYDYSILNYILQTFETELTVKEYLSKVKYGCIDKTTKRMIDTATELSINLLDHIKKGCL